MKTLLQNLRFIVLGLALTFALGSVSAGTWSAPSAVPTGGNIAVPIQGNTTAQTKLGALSVNGFSAQAAASFAQQTFIQGSVYAGTAGAINGRDLQIGDATHDVSTIINGATAVSSTITAFNVKKSTNDGMASALCADAAGMIVLCTAPVVAPTAPTATLTASPTSITSGSSSTLTWTSANSTSCTGTGFTAGTTSNSTGVSVSPTTTTTYTITCTGAAGTTPATSSVTVTAVSVPYQPNISVFPSTRTEKIENITITQSVLSAFDAVAGDFMLLQGVFPSGGSSQTFITRRNHSGSTNGINVRTSAHTGSVTVIYDDVAQCQDLNFGKIVNFTSFPLVGTTPLSVTYAPGLTCDIDASPTNLCGSAPNTCVAGATPNNHQTSADSGSFTCNISWECSQGSVGTGAGILTSLCTSQKQYSSSNPC